MGLLRFLPSALLGVALGFALTYVISARSSGFAGQKIGIWEFAPKLGAADLDPYGRARVFLSGELPLAAGEGFALRADRDAAGAPLQGSCHYSLTGPMPVARYWTLTLYLREGGRFANPADRGGFSSSEIIRASSGAFSIEIGPDPLAGNWLPAPPGQPFELVLRLYETPLSASATVLDAALVPRLVRVDCPR